MALSEVRRRLHRIEKAVKEALNAVMVFDLVIMPDGEEVRLPPGKLEEYEAKGATWKDFIIHVPDNNGAERGGKWH